MKVQKLILNLLVASTLASFALNTSDVCAKKKQDQGPFTAVSLCGQAKVSMKQAEETALKKVPGRVRRIELEKDDGVLIYEIIICQGRVKKEVRVDANSGAILEVDKKLGKCDEDDD